MKRARGMVEIMVSMRVKDVLAVIDRRYGSLDKLRKHVRRHPNDQVANLLYDTADRHKDEPGLVVALGQVLIGDPSSILGVTKLELLGQLMGRPAVGLRELARSLKKNPATVLEQLAQLEAAGLVLKESGGPGKAVSIRPLATELTIRVSAEAAA